MLKLLEDTDQDFLTELPNEASELPVSFEKVTFNQDIMSSKGSNEKWNGEWNSFPYSILDLK